LQDALNETEQKKRIALLFDLNNMSAESAKNLTALQKKQMPNGGFPWFGGEGADPYITQYILTGIGQLYKSGIADVNNSTLRAINDKAINYLDKRLEADEANVRKYDKKYLSRNLNSLEIHAWYARSYFKAAIDAELKIVQRNYINRAVAQWVNENEFNKAMIALTMSRFGDQETAQMIIKSLLETAQQSEELGMYWASNKQGYYWYQSPVETQTLMIELFTEVGNHTKEIEDMKIWLMINKQTNNWKTTKATAKACFALLVKSNDLLASNAVLIKVNGNSLQDLKPEPKTDAGTGYLKTNWVDKQIEPNLGKVEIKNSSKSINYGAMYWQYTEKLDKITSSNTNIQLQRSYYIQKQTDKGPELVAVDINHQPKTGDVLKVVVNLKADRDFDYIQLKDMRPSGTEPMNALSEYKYQDGLYYYQVTKDVATNFFISYLPKGSYVFEYSLRVVQPGNFATGITSVQCMYAPEFNANSEGFRIEFKP